MGCSSAAGGGCEGAVFVPEDGGRDAIATSGDAGDGPSTDASARDAALDAGGTCLVVSDVALGRVHTCAIDVTQGLWCWGAAHDGRLGLDGTGTAETVDAPSALDGRWDDVAAGESHTCALTSDGYLFCWGDNSRLQQGATSPAIVTVPTRIATADRFVSVEAGLYHTCALRSDGALVCFGANESGQLGRGDRSATSPGPARVGTRTYERYALGDNHSCAIVAAGGALFCWGSNGTGQLGLGATPEALVPTSVPLVGGAASVAAGWAFTCALSADGELSCTGANDAGELGVGDAVNRDAFEYVSGGRSFSDVTAGAEFTCAVEQGSGAGWCWGSNFWGQLGTGIASAADETSPQPVMFERALARVEAGQHHVCAITRADELYCWGANEYHQLGLGPAFPDDRTPLPHRVCF